MSELFDAIFTRPRTAGYVLLDRRSRVVREMDYRTLVERARLRAGGLRALGRPGTVVGLVFDDPLEFVVALFACLYAGLVGMPVTPRAALRNTPYAARPGCAGIVTQADLAPRFGAHAAPVHVCREGALTVPRPRADHEPCLVQLSSGTTGAPRPIAVTGRNVLSNERAIAAHFRHDAATRVLGWLPHTHDMGLFGTLLQPFFVDCVGYLAKPRDFVRDPLSWIRSVSRYRITTSGAPTFAYDTAASADGLLGDIDLSCWSIAFVGAEAVRASVLERFCARFAEVGFDPSAVMACYGLAEATLFVTGETPGRGLQTRGNLVSVGAAHEGVRLRRIRDQPWPSRGEILVSGPSVADGATWLATGDVGCIHRGRLYVCGRTKDMIKVRGCAVALSELDQCVAAALCGTAAEVCCLAAPEEAVTVIVQGAGSDCEGRQLSALLRSRFGVCANVRTVPSRPRLIVRTASGKLNRAATRERCRSAGIVDA